MTEFDNQTVQAIMDEALKYQGYPYVFGGASPETSFDCSGLTLWCFGKVGITLPRIAQAQYDATQHIPLTEAKAGDLVFFHSTYDTSDYVTHVGIVRLCYTCWHRRISNSNVSRRKSHWLW